MTAPLEAFESALVGLRDPMARVVLALGRLGAGADATQGALLRSIRDAISEIDGRIEDLLGGLAPKDPAGPDDADLGRVLREVVADLEPALLARNLRPHVGALPSTPVGGDAGLLRRAICRLLLGVGHWAEGDPAEVSLALRGRGDGGVAVVLDVEVPAEVSRPRRDALGPLEGLAAAREIRLEPPRATECSLGITAWLRSGPA